MSVCQNEGNEKSSKCFLLMLFKFFCFCYRSFIPVNNFLFQSQKGSVYGVSRALL